MARGGPGLAAARLLLALALGAGAALAAQGPGDALLERLRREDSAETRAALLTQLGLEPNRSKAAQAALQEAMFNDLSAQARQAAAIALLGYSGTAVLDTLDQFLQQEHGAEVRRQLCLALPSAAEHRGNPQVALLLSRVLAEDPSPAVRQAAARALELRGDSRAMGALQQAARGDASAETRSQAQKSLQALSKPRLAQPPKKMKVKPQNAVKGVDLCADGHAWCECERDSLRARARCMLKDECVELYLNSFQRLGYSCLWNNQRID